MHHLTWISSAVTILEVVTEDRPTQAEALTVNLNLFHVLKVAARTTDTLTTQVVKAYIRVEELILIAGIHRRWEIAIFQEKAFFFTGGMYELAKLSFTRSILEVMAEDLFNESCPIIWVLYSLGVNQLAYSFLGTCSFKIVHTVVTVSDRLAG